MLTTKVFNNEKFSWNNVASFKCPYTSVECLVPWGLYSMLGSPWKPSVVRQLMIVQTLDLLIYPQLEWLCHPTRGSLPWATKPSRTDLEKVNSRIVAYPSSFSHTHTHTHTHTLLVTLYQGLLSLFNIHTENKKAWSILWCNYDSVATKDLKMATSCMNTCTCTCMCTCTYMFSIHLGVCREMPDHYQSLQFWWNHLHWLLWRDYTALHPMSKRERER